MEPRTGQSPGGALPGLAELRGLLYNPNFSSDPDRSLAILNEVSGRSRPLTHADIDGLSDAEAADLAGRLRRHLTDRRGDNMARAKKKLQGG